MVLYSSLLLLKMQGLGLFFPLQTCTCFLWTEVITPCLRHIIQCCRNNCIANNAKEIRGRMTFLTHQMPICRRRPDCQRRSIRMCYLLQTCFILVSHSAGSAMAFAKTQFVACMGLHAPKMMKTKWYTHTFFIHIYTFFNEFSFTELVTTEDLLLSAGILCTEYFFSMLFGTIC